MFRSLGLSSEFGPSRFFGVDENPSAEGFRTALVK